MNWSFAIILSPALLVAIGYIVVLRSMGYAPGYSRLLLAIMLFGGAIYWLTRRSRNSGKTTLNQ